MGKHWLRSLAAILLAALCGCASLPENSGRMPSHALHDTDGTALGQAVAARTANHPGKDGARLLPSGREAFAMRMALMRAAQRSLDLQYYIWSKDTVGQLMFKAAWLAAGRGVRVRLLLDDQVTRGLDETLAVLDAHPNIEIRLFNPYANRRFRITEMAFDFARINRRMHNKAFIADNQMAIIGGRNIANEYYGAQAVLDYSDLDAVLVGPSVQQASKQFDLYWNSESAYPARRILGTPGGAETAQLQEEWKLNGRTPEARAYMSEVLATPLARQLLDHSLLLEWTSARVIYDDPEKVLQPPERAESHLLPRMTETMGRPTVALDIVSPYFVPGKEGTRTLVALQQQGVRVRILTNSLAATDVGVVHAGYKKYRKQLLQGGVTLYELKPGAQTSEFRQGENEGDHEAQHFPSGSSGASLHAKTFAIDKRRIFVGSFNLDPRSSRLNTEMGVVIESPDMARQLSGLFDRKLAVNAYLVRLAKDGRNLEWVEHTGQGEHVFTHEPGTSLLRRIWVNVLSILPFESLL